MIHSIINTSVFALTDIAKIYIFLIVHLGQHLLKGIIIVIILVIWRQYIAWMHNTL